MKQAAREKSSWVRSSFVADIWEAVRRGGEAGEEGLGDVGLSDCWEGSSGPVGRNSSSFMVEVEGK